MATESEQAAQIHDWMVKALDVAVQYKLSSAGSPVEAVLEAALEQAFAVIPDRDTAVKVAAYLLNLLADRVVADV